VRQAVGALTLIAKMHAQEPLWAQRAAWRDLMLISPDKEDQDGTLQFLTTKKGERHAKAYLAAWINGFPMDTWPIRFTLDPDWSVRTDTGLGFLSIVWFVIAKAAGGGRSVQICSGCNHPYIRSEKSRAPKTGQSNYCTKCGEKAKYAAAKKQSGKSRISRFRQLADFVLTLRNVSPPLPGCIDFLRLAWNDRFPEAAYHAVDQFEKDLGLMLLGSYRAVTGDKQSEVRFVMKHQLGFEADDLIAKEKHQ
jgi:hypothetical protein